MALIVCQSPKGGVGTSFVAAGLAQGLSLLGRDVVVLDFTADQGLKLYFGLVPGYELPAFDAEAAEPVQVAGVSLRSAFAAGHAPDFAAALADGDLSFSGETVYVADCAAADQDMALVLRAHADLHVCVLNPTAMALAQVPRISPGFALDRLTRTVFALNQLDETRRFSRHAALFLRELLGENLIAEIHRDEAVNEAVGMRQPLARYAPASGALAGLETLVRAVEQRIPAAAPRPSAEVVPVRPSHRPAAA